VFAFLHFVIKHAKRTRRIIFPSLTGLPLPYYFTLFHIRKVYGKELNTEYVS